MSQYVHPEFGFFCPGPGLRRCLRVALAAVAVGGIALGVMATGRDSDADSAAAVVAAADARAATETGVPVSFAPVAVVAPRSSAAAGARTAADKSSCLDSAASADGKCAAEKPRKPRMVRVGNRPAIASIPLGRTSGPHLGANDSSAAGAASGRQADTSKAAPATTVDAATAGPTEQAQKPATHKKKTAHNRRRDQNGYGRDVRVADWWSRGYGYGYSRGGYGRSFW
jgi:hypothetical protein